MIARAVISVILAVLVLGAGATIARVLTQTRPVPQETQTAPSPPLVRTQALRPESVNQTLVGYGSARAQRSALLTAEVGGEIVEIAAGLEDGTPVRAGQLLVRIDDRRYAQTLRQRRALADADQARIAQLDVEAANLRRLIEIADRELRVRHDEERRLADLFERDNASKTEYDLARLAHDRLLRERTNLQNQLELLEPQRQQLEASLAGRLADVEIAGLDVEHCRIVAPFDGQIDELSVEVGERVQRAGPIASLVDPLRMEVPVELPISARAGLAVGAAARMWMDSLPDTRWSGRVERISPDADERSRTFRAFVVVDNREQRTPLVPGCFLRAELTGPTLSDVLLVPRGAIIGNHVFVALAGRAARRSVSVDRLVAERAVVSGEIEAGDRVILTNLDLLEDGVAIRVDDRQLPHGTSR